MKTQKIAITKLNADRKIDVRRGLNADHVLYLAGLIEGGTRLPPPRVTGKTLTVVDGRHRIAAEDLLGHQEITVEFVSERSDADLIFAAIEANSGGALPPTVSDITHTIKQLLDLKVPVKDIVARLPMPATIARKYLGYVRSNDNKDRVYRALEGIREGRITLTDAAKKHNVSPTLLKKALETKKSAANIGSLKSVISRRMRAVGAANGKNIKRVKEMIDEGEWTAQQGLEFMAHIDHAINVMRKTHSDHMSRFVAEYGPATERKAS
jgi:hypothetical protein